MHRPMNLSKTLSVVFLTASLAFVGCKKKEDAAAPAAGSATKPAESATAAAPAATPPPATPPAAPAASAAPAAGAIVSDDEYIAKSTAAMDKIFDIFKSAGTNCDKLADGISKFAADSADLMKAVKAYQAAHPDVQKKFDDASKDKMKSFNEAAAPAMEACKDSKKVADAMGKMSAE